MIKLFGAKFHPIPGVVYVARSSRGPIKIGRTSNIEDRLLSLRAQKAPDGRRHTMELCFVTPLREDANAVEKETHWMLADKNLKGEWFNVDVAEAIAAVKVSAERWDFIDTAGGCEYMKLSLDPEFETALMELCAEWRCSPTFAVHKVVRAKAQEARRTLPTPVPPRKKKLSRKFN